MSLIFRQNKFMFYYCKQQLQYFKQFSLSSISKIKEISEKKQGNTIIISASIKPQNDDYLMKKHKSGSCPLCSYGLEVKHTDILIINQFLDSNGELIPRKYTGLCKVQHKRMDYLIAMAKAAGLLSKSYQKEEIPKNKKWMEYNTYYDEDTIKYKYF